MTLTTYAELEQGSQSWLDARCGLLTASTIGKLITPTTLKVADNETSRGLTMQLAAERITGHVDYVHPTLDMQRGHDDEPVARAIYAERFSPVEEFGFMVLERDGFKIGFSPDGLVGTDGIIEIKSRKPKEQIATAVAGRPPAYNVAQLQTALYVTGREWLDYVSFSAGLPLWVHRVYPDTRWFGAIEDAAAAFEINVFKIIANFSAATKGMPATERRPEYEEIRV